MKEMYYLFNDEETGEDFFVNANDKLQAILFAERLFESPKLVTVMTEEESEWYPYDVY
jgi:hypothetical protein